MNTHTFARALKYFTVTCLLAALVLGCERDLDELEEASFPRNPNVFINSFSAGLEYAAFGGSVPTAFDVDTRVTYSNTSEASMRFDVPNAGDPRGAYAGGAFFTPDGRDLSEYDALTFWAKASQSVSVDVIGFGNDLGESKFETSISGLQLTPSWQKYIIPIPDPSKLKAEKGMFFYSAGPVDGRGYTFWIDEMKYETLGTLAHPKFAILNGQQVAESSFIGVTRPISGLNASVNLPTGINQVLNVATGYFEFSSSNPNVATVDERGIVSVVGGPGSTTISATVGGTAAEGTLAMESTGQFQTAPVPTREPADVISIFSDHYENVPVNYYNGFWEPFQTTLSADFTIEGNNILNYTDFNFVGIEFSAPTVNATAMTHLHVNIFIPAALETDARMKMELVDFGSDGSGVFVSTIRADQARQWVTLEIPLASFAGLSSRANLAQIIFENESGNINNFYADNIYFFREDVVAAEPTVAAPTPTRDANDVISLFSDAYNDVPVDTWRTDWSNAMYEQIAIQGNATKKYSALDFVGIETVANQINATGMTHFHVDVWSPDFTTFSIKIVDFGPNGAFNGGDDAEHQIDIEMPAQEQWVSIDLPLSDFVGLTTKANIAQFILVGKPSGATTVYVDNMYFYREGGGAAPVTPTFAAPTPTKPAEDVLSIFSDSYNNVPGTDFFPGWGQSTVVTQVPIAGNNTLKYENFNYQGIQIGSTQNVSEYQFLHLDYYTVNAAALNVFLISPGRETPFTLNVPTVGWNSVDIPLSAFSSVVDLSEVIQFKFDGGSGAGNDVYLDNIYFFKSEGGGGGDGNCPSPPAGDFISNGDFEAGNTCWQLFALQAGTSTTIESGAGNGGGNAARIKTAQAGNPAIKQERFGVGIIQPNTTYSVEFDIRSDEANPLANGSILNAFTFSEPVDGSPIAATQHILVQGDANVPSTWTRRSYTFTTASNVDGGISLLIELVGGGATTTGTVFVDNVSLRAQ